jgi:hypothetical protein
MDEDSCFDNVDVLETSSTPMDQALARLHETMVKIIVECTQVQTLNFLTVQHHFFEELHKTFTTFIWPESTNPCTQEWYFAKWMMASKNPSTK